MKRPEDAIQRAVVQHLEARGVKGLVYFHVPNGGKRDVVTASILKTMGVRAGVSDLVLFYNKQLFVLELKAPGNKPTESQIEFLSDIDREGGFGAVATGLDQALITLEVWGLLRRGI
jgi:hypothetical protein